MPFRTPVLSCIAVVCLGAVALAAEPSAVSTNPEQARTHSAQAVKLPKLEVPGWESFYPALSPEQQQVIDEAVASRSWGPLGGTRTEAFLRAAEMWQGQQFGGPLFWALHQFLEQAPMIPPSTPEQLAEQAERLAARKAAREERLASRTRSGLTALPRYPLEAGAAVTNMTMPIGVPLPGWGRFPFETDPMLDPYDYAKIYKSNKGTRDTCRAKAVFLRVNGELFLWMGLDAVASEDQFRSDVLADIRAAGIPLKRENFIMTATHNHSGPGAVSKTIMWWVTTADIFNQEVYDMLRPVLTEAAKRAYAKLEPAEIGYIQREEPTMQFLINRRDDPEKIDKELGVIAFRRKSDQSPLAVLFNLGIHVSALGSANELFTADLAGKAERTIEATLGGDIVAMHVNGTEGDIDSAARSYNANDWIGRDFAGYVLGLLPAITYQDTVGLLVSSQNYRFPPPYVRPGHFDPATPLSLTIPISGLLADNSDFTALRLNDDAVIATMPGEVLTEIGWAIKAQARRLGFRDVFLFGLGQHHLSYFTSETEYWQGGYEAGASLFGPEGGMLIESFAVDVIDNVAR